MLALSVTGEHYEHLSLRQAAVWLLKTGNGRFSTHLANKLSHHQAPSTFHNLLTDPDKVTLWRNHVESGVHQSTKMRDHFGGNLSTHRSFEPVLNNLQPAVFQNG